jgi:hypothetical protein
VGCIERVMLMDPAGKEMKIDWKAVKPNEVELKLPLQDAKPGAATLLVSEYGASQPQSMPLQIFADAGHRDQFSVHAGDTAGILKGSRLDEVDSLTLKGVRFVPEPSDSGGRGDELPMAAADASSISALREDDAAMARITLKDGRVFDVKSQVTAPRHRWRSHSADRSGRTAAGRRIDVLLAQSDRPAVCARHESRGFLR